MGNSTIKGITIEIGGETTKLDKALSEVNKQARSIQSELKQVEKLLKLDPKNTELLAQKQKLLKEAIGQTKDKLDTLKQAEAQAQQQFARGDISEEQYRALQREIQKTEQELKTLETTAKNSNSTIQSIGDVAGKIGEKSQAIGNKMLPITGAIVGFGTAAVASMDAVDEGLDTVVTKTGATGEAAKDLQRVYENVASTIPGDFGDIGAAVGELNTRLGFTGDTLEKASEDFLKFAKVNGVDVEQSVQLVTRAMGDAGINADEYGGVLDMLTVASQKSGISIESLTTNLAKYGAPMRALGIDTQNSIALFAGWEKAGVNTETAFSGMKKAISNWSAAGKDASVEFGNTLQQIKDAPDIASATTLAIDAFGTKAGPDLADAIQGGRFEVEEYVEALKNAGGTVETTYNGIVDEVDDSALAMQTAQIAMHDIGETIAKMIGPVLLSIANKIKDVADRFNSLDKNTQEMIIKILAIVAAIGPALIIFGKLSTGVSAICGGVSKLSGLLGGGSGLSGILTAITGPVGIVIGIIAALAAGFIYLYNTNDAFREKVQTLIATIQEKFAVLQETLKPAIAAIQEAFNNLMLALQPIFEFIMTFISGIVSGVMAAAEPIMLAITNIVEFVTNIINAVVALLTGDFDGFFLYLSQALQNIGSFISNIVTAIVNFVIGFFQSFGVNVKQIFSDIWAGICNIFSGCGQWFADRFTEAYNFITGIFAGIGGWFSQRWTDITNALSSVGSWFSDTFSSAWQAIKNVFSGWGSFFSGLWNQICNTFTNLGTNIASAISGAVKSGINGVISMIENTINGAISIINGAIRLINKLPGVSIGTVGNVGLPRLAKGGVLTNGRAIVAEAGPEIIEMVNGKTIVTPLSGAAKNTSLERNLGGSGKTQNDITLKIENFYNNRQQDIRELTEEILEIAEEIKGRGDKVYA